LCLHLLSLLLAKAYLFHKNFDTAGSLLQYINYTFDTKEAGMDIPIGSNLRNTKGQFSIATKEDNKFYENRNIRNESMLWQARNYFETNSLNEGISLLQLLKTDAFFPKRLHPFLFEQLAYGYYQSENYDSAAAYLTKGLSNAPDKFSKTRWYYLIAQLWEKSDNLANAYTWYKKAHSDALNPLISVYAKINLIKIFKLLLCHLKEYPFIINLFLYLSQNQRIQNFCDEVLKEPSIV